MKETSKLKPNSGALLVFILTVGVFGIINTEMGVIGILPLIAETFHVTVPEAGWTVSIFALVVALSAPVTPLLFSGVNRKKVMFVGIGSLHIEQYHFNAHLQLYGAADSPGTSGFSASRLCLYGFHRCGCIC